MAQNKVPFRKWVPGWLRALVGFSILVPIIMLNGAYTGSSVDISGALGVLSEDISMAYYAASAGMAAGYPLIPKIRPIATTKTILLCDLIIQILLSFLCAKTESMGVIIFASFFIGFFKAFALLEMIIILKPIFSRRDIRSEFYAYFYPIVFGLGQISMILTSELAYNYKWQYMYYLVIVLLLIAVVLVLVCFRYGRRPIIIPFSNIDKKSLLLISSTFLITVYVFTYGKTRDWFESSDILICSLIIPILFWLFIKRQSDFETPYLNYSLLKSKKAIIGYSFMAIVMFISASSSLVSSFATTVLKTDSIHSNGLNLGLIPGFIFGAILCFWWFRLQIWRFRVLAFWGMFCFVCYLSFLYFGLSPDTTYEFLFIPMFFRGAGMMILFIAFGVYAVEDVNPKFMIYGAFFTVAIRSLLSPLIGSSFFSNILYRSTQKSNMVLSENIDMLNSVSASRYSDALNSALSKGYSMGDAEQIAMNNLYSTLNTQSLLLSIKIIIGYLLIFSIIVMIIARFTSFHGTLKFKIVKSGDDMA